MKNKSNSSDTVVSIENVSFKYNHENIIDNITLSVKRGEFLGLIGPNGSGKTTLLRIILGVLKPTHGKVYLFDKELSQFKNWKKIGYVPQKSGTQFFNFPVTVEEIVEMGILGKRDKNKVMSDALEAVEMQKHRQALISELSGGQQQRVFIARALASNPELLVLDEPTAGVDSQAQANFYKLLRKLNKELKLTLILVSHDIDVIANEVTTVACINGKLICHLPPKEFIKSDYIEKVYGKDLKFIVHGH